MTVGDDLFYELQHEDLESSEATLTLGLISRIKRFALYNATESAFFVNGNLVQMIDVGRWDIHVELTYETAPYQSF